MKISKQEAKLHNQVMELVESDKSLTLDDKFFILENYQESATNINGLAGAFFTPWGLARDAILEIDNNLNIVDLCAGIGMLSFSAMFHKSPKSITCVELNPEYLKVGKRVLPEANWILGDALLFNGDSKFDVCISNPPFGVIKTSDYKGKYKGSEFEYKVIDHASEIARHGMFIIPQLSAGFKLSGNRTFELYPSSKHSKFVSDTGINLINGAGCDTTMYLDDWHGVSPTCEIVICDFEEGY